jgi:hypothetical protein
MTCRILLKLFQFVKKREETPTYSFEARYKLNQYHIVWKSDACLAVKDIQITGNVLKEHSQI